MPRLGAYRETLLRLIVFVVLVIVTMIPVSSRAATQNTSTALSVVRSFNTSEYGIHEPKGLAYSSVANAFLLLDRNAGVTLITMDEDHAGNQVISEVLADPLNAAFDDHSSSLFVFDRGRSELARVLPDASAPVARFSSEALALEDPQGIAFNPADGRLFILDAGKSQVVSVVLHPTLGLDASGAIRSNKIGRVSLKKVGTGPFRGLAYNPSNGHLFVSEPSEKKLYELTQSGDLVSSFDLAALGINHPSAMTFAPSVDNTDDPSIFDLFLLDEGIASSGQSESSESRIVELSLVAPAALPAGITPLATTVVHIIDTSKAAWRPSAPDPAGVDYWPAAGALLISDSEVEEMPTYFTGKNVFLSTLSGALVGACSTTSFSNEPTGVAINPNNNHIFFSDDTGANDKVFEVSLGADGAYCTADDTVTATNVSSLYGVNDAEDVAYGNNTLFIAGGASAEVYRIPLGANGVLGGGDDGAMTHFDTASLGFSAVEGLGYNSSRGTLWIVSPQSGQKYLGETTTTGALLSAYNLAYSGLTHPEDVTFAPGSQNASVINAYLTDRGIDNNTSRTENDGEIWELSLGSTSPTLPGKASLISPSGSITTTTPTYTWNTVSNATWYYLWVNNAAGTAVIKQWYMASQVCGSGSTCSVAPAATLAGGNYTWWIQTWNDVGYGPWSNGKAFSVQTISPPGAATLISPSGSITTPTATYRWNKVNSSTWYYLWINNAAGTAIGQKWYPASQVCGSSTCSVTPSLTLSAGNYTWWIQTWNDGGYGPWSNGMNFTVAP